MSIQQQTWHGRLLLASSVLVGVGLACPSPCQAQIRLTGVNLAGAEFGQTSLPGTFGTNYIYPYTAEVDYFFGKGMNTVRLPFRWERLQQSQNAQLNSTELGRINDFVNYATGLGGYVILEPHNFARYYPMPASNFQGSSIGVVGGDVPNASFADFWSRVADEFEDNDHVIFNLMNEPANMPTEQWFGAAQAAVNAIRDAGATNLIMVPGNGYSGAHSWTQNYYGTPNAEVMLNIVDPGDNFVYDVHQYLDHNSSGTSTQIGTDQNINNTNIGVERLTEMTEWLRENERKAFLGEFAVANSRIGDGVNGDGPQIGDETIENMLDYIQANDDVWTGWAWWAAGPWWDGGPAPSHENRTPYMFLLDPANLGDPNETDKQAMAVLQPYLADNLPGDYNFDGVVNAADYTAWRDTRGQTGAASAADANFDGIVGDEDYDTWVANFGNTLPGAGAGSLAGAAVPEPGALALLAAGCSFLGLSARRHQPSRRRR